jgi:threonine aldolase
MGNQIAIGLHARPGDEGIVGEGAHSVFYESGAAAGLFGVQLSVAGSGGLFDVAELEAKLHPKTDWSPRVRVVLCEDTHNRAGGRVWPFDQLARISEAARRHGLARHLDGARLWNAAAASGDAPARRASLFDSATVCLSKGLGAPVGSVLVGDQAFIAEARRRRKMMGGGMRQVGVLAAAGLYALEHHLPRLAEDHLHARRIAERLAGADVGARIDLAGVETNIVNVDYDVAAERVVAAARDRGVWVSATGPHRVRLVLHLEVDGAAADRAAEVLIAASRDARR